MARSGGATWSVEIEGARTLQRALRVLQEPDAPYLREALERSGQLLRAAAARRAPGSIARSITFAGVKGTKSHTLKAVIRVKHPGARSMEFGRQFYYRGYRGRAMRATGQRFRVPSGRGQQARPYLGVIKGNAAIAEVHDEVAELLTTAIEREWQRIGGGD